MARLAASLLFVGIGSFVLPLIGMDLGILQGLDPVTRNWVAGGCIVGGLLFGGMASNEQ